MTKIYNKSREKNKRRILRSNMPNVITILGTQALLAIGYVIATLVS